jgi:hypothetical protein
MSSKLWPVAFDSKCAFSNSPQPSPVDVLSACSVSTATPVSSEILCTGAAFETTAAKTRNKAAVIKLNAFILIELPLFYLVSVLTR